MSTEYEILKAAANLAKENKKPTVALLKSRLPNSTPLALIIKGLQQWQANPRLPEREETKQNSAKSKSKTEIESLIEQKIAQSIAPLKQKIIELENELKRLQAKD
ncbi:hypothetical protein [Thalassotalea aquiviva]|uniref:hypothetical protein n=1 Tax=Thalassotalea aquiviva TaxID=3242415 RepID=UPI00352A5307